VNIAEVAALAYMVNRAYCAEQGNTSEPAWTETSDGKREAFIAGTQKIVLGLSRGIQIAPWDAHNEALKKRVDAGWTYGEKEDPEAKTHPLVLPFDKLPKAQQLKTFLFIAVIEACYRAGIDP